MMPNQSIRQQLRQQRRNLTHEQREKAAYDLANLIINQQNFKTSKNIACYLPVEGEISLWPLIEYCWQQNKQVFLPVLRPRNHHPLWFIRFEPDTPLISNRYQISEPLHHNSQRNFKNIALDMILLPLVAFDQQGNRLGMGAGYYDRTLNTLKTRKIWLKPCLIGVGYAFQQVKTLKTNLWDVPMHMIATEKAIYRIKS